MLWSKFQEQFPEKIKTDKQPDKFNLTRAEAWARKKLILTDRDVYSPKQTHNGAWAEFNQRTRAMKGLIPYESVYRWYIDQILDGMMAENVMLTELRSMLMDKTIPSDDGTRELDHKDQMEMILEVMSEKKVQLARHGNLDKHPLWLKIIYCAPRSISRERMLTELEDCLRLKLQFPELICGFDLVGAEDRPKCINFYADQLVAFVKTCRSVEVDIPFIFHAGESLIDCGGSYDPENSNLFDAVLLNAKRIGHGYALTKHPALVEECKEKNISLELCTISNELPQLCGNARQHPYPQLLAAGLHCCSLERGQSSAT